MVVDNAPCHSNIEEVFSEEEFLGCEVLRLAPYSPMFNPIEQVWSLIKAYVKQELAAKIQNGNSSVQNGKIIISINIKKYFIDYFSNKIVNIL